MKIAKDSVLWVASQQLIQRGLIAGKFFLIAKFLGATEIGIISILLLILAILESISDFGMNAIFASSKEDISKEEKNALWIWLIIRGWILFVLYMILIYTLSEFNIYVFPELNFLMLYLFGIILLFRSLTNIGIYELYRQRNFLYLFKFNSIFTIIDFSISLFIIFGSGNLNYLVLIIVASEMFKMIFTNLILPTKEKLKLDISLESIRNKIQYGKNIWKNNCLIMFLSQTDKFLISILYTPFYVGIYQMIFKISSLVFSDLFAVFNQYYLALISKNIRVYGEKMAFKKITIKVYLIYFFSFFLALILINSYELITKIFLDEKWLQYSSLFSIVTFGLLFGSWNSLIITIFNAFSKPQVSSKSIYIQVFTTIIGIFYIILVNNSLKSVALIMSISNFICFLSLLFSLIILSKNLSIKKV